MRTCLNLRGAIAVSFAIGFLLSIRSGDARANRRFPAATQLAVSPSDPSLLALRTTFGILISHDGGATWGWVCEHAVGYGDAGVEDPTLGMFRSAIMAGIFEGIAISRDEACTFDFASTRPIVDVAVRPNDPRAALALTSQYAASADAASSSSVLATTDEGAHWAPQGASFGSDFVGETVDVAANDPQRIYVSGTRARASDGAITPLGFLFVSYDDGAHYVERAIDLDPATESAPFIAAVDPSNADRIYVRIKGTMGSRLLASDDAGATFRTVFKAQGDLLGFALSPSGDAIYTGGPLDGIWMADRQALLFVKKGDAELQCLTRIGNTLYACMSDPSAFARQLVATSIDDGVTFVPKFALACIDHVLGCPPSSATAACASELAQVTALLAPLQCDAGAPVGAIDAGDSPGNRPDSSIVSPSPSASSNAAPSAPSEDAPGGTTRGGCGCDTGSPWRGGTLGILGMISWIILARRRATIR